MENEKEKEKEKEKEEYKQLEKENIEDDIYLINFTLQSCIKKYMRRLYDVCKILDMDLEDNFYKEESDEGDFNKEVGIETNLSEKYKINEHSHTSNKNQPQILPETLCEATSKWSHELRKNEKICNFAKHNSNESNFPKKLSKATCSRISLKEQLLNMNPNDKFVRGRSIRKSPDVGNRLNNTLQLEREISANIITSSDSRILKQSFKSLFNI